MPLYTSHCPQTTPHVIAALTQNQDNALAGMAETLPQLAKLLTKVLLKRPTAILCLTMASAAAPNTAIAGAFRCSMQAVPEEAC